MGCLSLHRWCFRVYTRLPACLLGLSCKRVGDDLWESMLKAVKNYTEVYQFSIIVNTLCHWFWETHFFLSSHYSCATQKRRFPALWSDESPLCTASSKFCYLLIGFVFGSWLSCKVAYFSWILWLSFWFLVKRNSAFFMISLTPCNLFFTVHGICFFLLESTNFGV